MHTLLSLIILYELCTVAILGHLKLILLRNHVRIIVTKALRTGNIKIILFILRIIDTEEG